MLLIGSIAFLDIFRFIISKTIEADELANQGVYL